MKFKTFYTAVAALSLAGTSTIAAAAPVATPLTQRAATETKDDSQLARGSGILVALLAIAAVAAGIVAAASSDGSAGDAPNSP